MASWVESTGFVAQEPARLAVLVALAQSGEAIDDASLSQSAGLIHQQFVGHPLETAVLMAKIRELADRSLLERDETGFRWRMTARGELVVGQWVSSAFDPPGDEPLGPDDIRAWRDRLLDNLEHSAELAERAEVSFEELAAGCALRLAELRVLNRISGDIQTPSWLEPVD